MNESVHNDAGNPVQWTLRGLITSQLGNLDNRVTVVDSSPGTLTSPREFIFDMVSHFVSQAGLRNYVTT